MDKPVIVFLISTLIIGHLVVHSDDPDIGHRKAEDRSIQEKILKAATMSTVFENGTSTAGPITFWGVA